MTLGRIYKIVHSQSNMIYVGSTFDEIRFRWRSHKSSYKRYLSDKKTNVISLYPFIEKYGIENFKIMLIKEYDVIDRRHLHVYEQLWINKLACINVSNSFGLKRIFDQKRKSGKPPKRNTVPLNNDARRDQASQNCKFCNSFFKTSETLRKHSKKPPVYCQKIRQENTCHSCSKVLHFDQPMDVHLKGCHLYLRTEATRLCELEKKSSQRELDHQKFIYENKLRQLQKEVDEEKKLRDRVEVQLQETIIRLSETKTEKEKISEKYEKLALTCASKDTSTTIHHNNSRNTVNQLVNYLESVEPLNLNKDRIESIVNSQYTKKHLMGGQRGLANFVADNLLKNEENKTTYVTTDRSRGVCKYLTEDGTVRTDTKAENVIDVVYEPVLSKIKNDIFDPTDRYDGSYDSDDDEYINHTRMRNKYRSIQDLKHNSADFYKQLSSKIKNEI